MEIELCKSGKAMIWIDYVIIGLVFFSFITGFLRVKIAATFSNMRHLVARPYSVRLPEYVHYR